MTQRSKTSLLAILLSLSFTVAAKAQSAVPAEKTGAAAEKTDAKDNKNAAATEDRTEENEKNEDKNVEKQDVRLVQVGHVVKVDQKKRTITIEDAEESADQPQQPQGHFRSGIGRTGRRGGFGRIGGGTGASAAQADWPQKLRTKIWITDATLVEDGGKVISWENLRKGDVVQVSGTPKKKDLEAKEIDIVQHVGED